MSLQFRVELSVINSYKRLAYTAWHAIAEFVDNSTQSFFDNRELLMGLNKADARPLTVQVDYEASQDILRVRDNTMGMSFEDLERALHVSQPPPNTSGRSRYGMGLKTAACWIGNVWSVRSKKYGETVEYFVEVDVAKIASGNNDLSYSENRDVSIEDHYTILEIRNHNRKFKTRTLGKIGQYLRSMYRQDFRNGDLTLIWRGSELNWDEYDERWAVDRNGNAYFKEFEFWVGTDSEEANDLKDKRVHGWVGVLREGSRSDAGFSILLSNRVIKGWPVSWRPETIFGYERNDLVNQRLVGEIHLDDFVVSHTKDDIQWLGDQEEEVERLLLESCRDYVQYARDSARAAWTAEVHLREKPK